MGKDGRKGGSGHEWLQQQLVLGQPSSSTSRLGSNALSPLPRVLLVLPAPSALLALVAPL